MIKDRDLGKPLAMEEPQNSPAGPINSSIQGSGRRFSRKFSTIGQNNKKDIFRGSCKNLNKKASLEREAESRKVVNEKPI
jgi:hypothetical protein